MKIQYWLLASILATGLVTSAYAEPVANAYVQHNFLASAGGHFDGLRPAPVVK